MKKRILLLLLFLISFLTFSQDMVIDSSLVEAHTTEQKLSAAIDIVYPYFWRGLRYTGDRLAVQPYISYALTNKVFVGVWATTNFSNAADAYNEFDWNISYQVSPVLTVMLSDYYWPATKRAYLDDSSNSRGNYFDYSEGSAQTLDFSILLDFSEKGLPLDFQWSTLVGGNDYKYDVNENPITRAFSSYAEIGYTFSLQKAIVDIRPFVGAVVINGGYYGVDSSGKAGFTFSNVGIDVAKELRITEEFSLPVFVRYTNNDYGIQKFDVNDNLTKTVRNFFSMGATINIK